MKIIKYLAVFLLLLASNINADSIFSNKNKAVNSLWHNNKNSELLLDGAFFPESISATWWGTIFVSSITSGEIVKFQPNDESFQTFVPVGTNINSTGIFVDHYRNVLWSCNVDLSGVEPSDLRAFDLATAE